MGVVKGFDFSRWLGEMIRTREMSQLQVAQHAGINTSNITHYLYGSRIPNLKTFLILLDVFGMHMEIKENENAE